MKQLFIYEQVAKRIANIRMIKTVKQLFIYEQVVKRIANIRMIKLWNGYLFSYWERHEQ